MGGIDASISRAGIGVVLKALVMNCNALFCAVMLNIGGVLGAR